MTLHPLAGKSAPAEVLIDVEQLRPYVAALDDSRMAGAQFQRTSPHSARIVTEVAIPFAYPRPPELRFEPEFASLAGQISAKLRANLE